MICLEFFEVKFIFKESEDGELFELLAKGDIDGCELFTGDAQFDEDLIGDRNCCKIELYDIGSQISYFIDELV